MKIKEFIKGVLSVFDLSGSTFEFPEIKSDYYNLGKDLQNIKSDFDKAINQNIKTKKIESKNE